MATSPKHRIEAQRNYLEGVARKVADELGGPAGPDWGTTLTELEDLALAARQIFAQKLLPVGLERQAASTKAPRPADTQACPDCARSFADATDPQPRTMHTRAGAVFWEEPQEYGTRFGVDGGRLQILERTAHGQAVVPAAAEDIQDDLAVPEPTPAKKPLPWREDKIGLLLTMTSVVHAVDPCPHIPQAFVNAEGIAKLARELKGRSAPRAESLGAEGSPSPPASDPAAPWEPAEVAQKEVVAPRRPWEAVGPMVAERAWSLGFFAAPRRAFLEDGAENNGALWRRYFSSFVPMLDFIHALRYVFHAAMAGRGLHEGWQV